MLAGVITMIVQTIFESSFYDEKLPRDTQYRKLRESAKDKKKSIFKWSVNGPELRGSSQK